MPNLHEIIEHYLSRINQTWYNEARNKFNNSPFFSNGKLVNTDPILHEYEMEDPESGKIEIVIITDDKILFEIELDEFLFNNKKYYQLISLMYEEVWEMGFTDPDLKQQNLERINDINDIVNGLNLKLCKILNHVKPESFLAFQGNVLQIIESVINSPNNPYLFSIRESFLPYFKDEFQKAFNNHFVADEFNNVDTTLDFNLKIGKLASLLALIEQAGYINISERSKNINFFTRYTRILKQIGGKEYKNIVNKDLLGAWQKEFQANNSLINNKKILKELNEASKVMQDRISKS
jgi:hypothetical protein